MSSVGNGETGLSSASSYVETYMDCKYQTFHILLQLVLRYGSSVEIAFPSLYRYVQLKLHFVSIINFVRC